MEQHIYVKVGRDAEGYPPYDVEVLDATPVGPSTFRIDAIPLWVRGLSRHDVVRVVRDPSNRWWIDALVSVGGHRTVRLIVAEEHAEDVSEAAVVSKFVAVGCLSYQTTHRVVPIDIPPNVDWLAVLEVLDAGEASGVWGYEISNTLRD
jgi:hypothetical protein